MKPRPGADWAHLRRLRLAQRPRLAQQPGLPGAGAGALRERRDGADRAGQAQCLGGTAGRPGELQGGQSALSAAADHRPVLRRGAVGELLPARRRDRLRGWKARCSTQVALGAPGLFVPDDGQAGREAGACGRWRTTRTAPPHAAVGSMSRLQARVIKAGAVTASVGLGTAATFGVAAWQGIDSWRAQRAETQSGGEQRVQGSHRALGPPARRRRAPAKRRPCWRPNCCAPATCCAATGSDNFMAKFRLRCASSTMPSRPARTKPPEQRTPACARLLDPGNGIDCLQPAQAPPCAPRYWARDYSGQTGSKQNCSGTLPEPWPVVVRLRDLDRRPARAAGRGRAAVGSAGAQSPPPTANAGERLAAAPHRSRRRRPALQRHRGLHPDLRPRAARQGALMARTLARAGRLGAADRGCARAPRAAPGARRPPAIPSPSVVIRDEAARACAQALVQTAASPTGQPWVIKMLPRSNRAAPGAIEVWLPRGKDASAA